MHGQVGFGQHDDAGGAAVGEAMKRLGNAGQTGIGAGRHAHVAHGIDLMQQCRTGLAIVQFGKDVQALHDAGSSPFPAARSA